MDLLEERAILTLDFIPELMALLNAFSTQGFRIKELWDEAVAPVSYQCPTCNEIVLFINKDKKAEKYYCRECGSELPSDQLIVKLRALIDSSEAPVPIRQEFLFEILSLWRGYQFKGIRVGKLFAQITRNLRLYNIERRLRSLLEMAPHQRQVVLAEDLEKLVDAFVRHKIIAPAIERNEAEQLIRTGSFNRWLGEHKEYPYRYFADMITRYVIWLDGKKPRDMRVLKQEDKNGKNTFLLSTVRDFISDVKAHSLAFHSEGLPLENVWGNLFRHSISGSVDPLEEGTELIGMEPDHLWAGYSRVLSRIQERYEKLGLCIGNIYRDTFEELRFAKLVEDRDTIIDEIIPLRQFLNDGTSLEDFAHKVIVREISRFITLLSDKTTANFFLRPTFGDAQVCQLNWHFIGDFLSLLFGYHQKELRDIKTHWETAIRREPVELNTPEAITEWDSYLGTKFSSDLQTLSRKYRRLELPIDKIWRVTVDELKLLDELDREDVLQPGTSHFRTPLLERRFRTEKFIKGRCWARLGFFVAIVLYDIGNMQPCFPTRILKV